MGKATYLIKNTFWFALGTFVPKALSFIMIPLYTACLTTDEYGTVDVLSTTVSLLIPILTLEIHNAVMKVSVEQTGCREAAISAAVRVTAAGGMLLAFGILSGKFFFHISIEWGFIVFLWSSYLFGALNNCFSFFCRGIDQVHAIAKSCILMTVTNVCCNLVFLLVLRWGIYGFLGANIAGQFAGVAGLFAFADIGRYLQWRWSEREKWLTGQMIRFSIPLIFSSLSWWINNSSDKYFLAFFCGVSVTGLYAVSGKIPLILFAVTEVVGKAYSISAIKEYDPNDTDGFLGKSYDLISFIVTVSCALLILITPWLARIMFSGEFYVAWQFVPPLLVAVLMNQLSQMCQNIFLAQGKSKTIMTVSMLAAVVNTVLNFWLIPAFGAYGAAIATVFGFTTSWIASYRILVKTVRMKNRITRELFSYILLMVQVGFAYFGVQYIGIQIGLVGGILLLYQKNVRSMFDRTLKKISQYSKKK